MSIWTSKIKLRLKKARYSRAGKRLEFHLRQVQNQTKLNKIYFRTHISVVKLEGKQGNCKQLSTWQSPLGKAEERCHPRGAQGPPKALKCLIS